MATRAVTDEQLQDIADSIKLKSGDDTPMSVADMALRIGLIEGGGVRKCEVIIEPTTVIGQTSDYIINHDLGVLPDLFLIYDMDIDVTPTNNGLAWAALMPMLACEKNPHGLVGSAYISAESGNINIQTTMPTPGSVTGNVHSLTSSSVIFRRGSANGQMRVGRRYKAVFIKW